MISAESGVVEVVDRIKVAPTASLATVSNLRGSSASDWKDHNRDSWVRITLKPYSYRDREMVATFVFCNGALFSSAFELVEDRFGSSWSDWSKQRELNRKTEHDMLLEEMFGAKRVFHWGKVWSDFDSRSGGSAFGINYSVR